jgi:hypothetical protein
MVTHWLILSGRCHAAARRSDGALPAERSCLNRIESMLTTICFSFLKSLLPLKFFLPASQRSLSYAVALSA